MRTEMMTQSTSFEEECREVLDSVWQSAAAYRNQPDPARTAACERLLRHMARISRAGLPEAMELVGPQAS